jgi:hypothetical protein
LALASHDLIGLHGCTTAGVDSLVSEVHSERAADILGPRSTEASFEWRSAGLPRTGQLDGTPAIEYAFHGDGLRLTIGGDRVDFDFGFDGRTGGFDDWWLAEYAAEHPAEFPEFQDRARLSAAVAAGRSAGEIIRPFRSQQDNLDYLAADIRAQAS